MLRVSISETNSGWHVSRDDFSEGVFFKTAAEALGSVTAGAMARAEKNGGRDVTVIEWEARSRVGHLIVRALAKVGE